MYAVFFAVLDNEVSDFVYNRAIVFNVMSPQYKLTDMIDLSMLMDDESISKFVKLNWGPAASARRSTSARASASTRSGRSRSGRSTTSGNGDFKKSASVMTV